MIVEGACECVFHWLGGDACMFEPAEQFGVGEQGLVFYEFA